MMNFGPKLHHLTFYFLNNESVLSPDMFICTETLEFTNPTARESENLRWLAAHI